MIIVHTVSWNNNPAMTSVHHRELLSCSSCQKVCWYTIPMRKHLVTSLLILFLCQTPSWAKVGNETLSEPGRLNRMWELTGIAASAKLWGFLPLPSHRTQDQSPWLTELIATWRFLSAGKLMYRLIIQATLFGENTIPAKSGLPVLLLSSMIFSTYRSFQLVINQSIKKCQTASIICKAGDLMAWTNEGRCCKITQLLLISLQLTPTSLQPNIARVENVICHLHPKEATALKDSWEITISWFPNQFSHTPWDLYCLHPSPSYATCHITTKHCTITKRGYRHFHFNFCQNYMRSSAVFNLPWSQFPTPFFRPFYSVSTLPSLTCSAPPVPPALRPDHSSVLHKALVCRWKGVYSRIRQLLYMPQWLRNALLPHSRTGSNTSNSRLQSGAKKTALSDLDSSERVLL